MTEQRLGTQIRRLPRTERNAKIEEVVAQFRSSGKSQSAFSEEVGIAPITLGRWLHKVAIASKRAPPKFVEVSPVAPKRTSPYEVTLGSGTRVRVPSGFNTDELRSLLETLNAAC